MLAPFDLFDHVTVKVSMSSKSKTNIKPRNTSQTKRLAIRSCYLEEVHVQSLVDDQISCEDKTTMLARKNS